MLAAATFGQQAGYAWVTNPFTSTVSVTLTQPITVGLSLLDAGGAEVVGDALVWHGFVSPLVTEVFTWTFQIDGNPGTEYSLPAADVELTTTEGETITDTMEAGLYTTPWPVSSEYSLPTLVAPVWQQKQSSH